MLIMVGALGVNIRLPEVHLPWNSGGAGPDGAGKVLQWSEVEMEEGVYEYAHGGSGLPVLFLHGWGVSPRTYRESLAALASVGCRVVAPFMPGLGRAPRLASRERSFEAYADWVVRFLDAAGFTSPVVATGHSFGGGVAIQVAHDRKDLVRSAILLNPVGGPVGFSIGGPVRPMAGRHIWEWGEELGVDLLTGSSIFRVLPAVAEGVLPNLLHANVLEVLKLVNVVRRADLMAEMGGIGRSGPPVTVVWSDRDRLVPRAAVTGLAHSAGAPLVVTEGSHTWLIGDPEGFADLMLRTLVAQGMESDLIGAGIEGTGTDMGVVLLAAVEDAFGGEADLEADA